MNNDILNLELKLSDKDTCFEYCEDKEKLKYLLNEISVKTEYSGYYNYFPDDKEKRIILNVIIKKGEKEINFSFGMSIYDTEILNKQFFIDRDIRICHKVFRNYAQIRREKKRIINDLLYNILTCIKSDYFIPDRFTDFCSDFGYNEDSIKALNMYNKCIEQKQKLEKIFIDTDIELLPE